MKKISLLGSTGSIGKQTLEVVDHLNYKVVALAANENVDLLEQQARQFRPELVCVFNETLFSDLKLRLADCSCKIVTKMEGLCEAAGLSRTNLVFNAVVGTNGLLPTFVALENGKNVAMANKESLVVAGDLILKYAKKKGCQVLPVDSEHSAIFQCMNLNAKHEVKKLILTASGGPFLNCSREKLENVSVEQALNHPKWKMGRKISVDSATLMNKGLELIEACHLFNQKVDDVEIVIHPQAVLHSAVLFCDGSVIGQFGVSDMRLPIQFALTYPSRMKSVVKPFSFFDLNELNFSKPDYETFGCLNICKFAAKKGGFFPAIVHAANEKAVELFLKRRIGFLQIEELVKLATKVSVDKKQFTIKTILQVIDEIKIFVQDRAEKLVCN